MLKVRVDVQADAVEGHPVANPNTNRGDLVFAPVTVPDPDAHAAGAALAFDVELRQGTDEPFLKVAHELSDVLFALLEVEHDVSDALSGPVIGVLAAASGPEHGKSRVKQVAVLRARAGRVKGRVLEQPNFLLRDAAFDRVNSGFHARYRIRVRDRLGVDGPFNRA
jgi:hypothetical protein